MANATGVVWGVGLRRAMVFPLDADGNLQPSSTSAYEGIELIGPRAFDLTTPASRRIPNLGNDRVRDVIFLPPTDPVTGELRAGYVQHDLILEAAGITGQTVGEALVTPLLTDAQGSEVDVALLLTQIGHNADGSTNWNTYLIPKARLVFSPASMNDNALEVKYDLAISTSTKHIWGKALDPVTDGVSEMAVASMHTVGKPAIVAWKADGTEDEFLFPTDKPALATAKVALFNATTGAAITTGITVTSTKITFSVAPTANTILVAKYEY